MRTRDTSVESGFTLLELLVSMTVIGVMSVGFFSLFTALVNSSTLAKQRSVGGTLANNQMEYLRSLPYDSLAVSGGSIISSSYIPATTTKKELIPIKCGIFTVFLSVIDSELWNRFHSYPWKSMGFGIVSNVGIDFI